MFYVLIRRNHNRLFSRSDAKIRCLLWAVLEGRHGCDSGHAGSLQEQPKLQTDDLVGSDTGHDPCWQMANELAVQ